MSIRRSVGALVLSASALAGIALDEGFSWQAVIPVPGDRPTIGFGETAGVKMGDRTTPERALARLLVSANKHADGVRQCVKVPLYQYEFDAYVSLAYNVGVGAVCRSSIPRKLRAGQYAAACKTILDFNGKIRRDLPKVWDAKRKRYRYQKDIYPGLVKRRRKEYQTCMGQS